jgi:hypothetical protein
VVTSREGGSSLREQTSERVREETSERVRSHESGGRQESVSEEPQLLSFDKPWQRHQG